MSEIPREEDQSNIQENKTEDLRNRLSLEGLEEKDIDISIKMADNIFRLNTLIFGDTALVTFYESADKEHIASYTPSIPEENVTEGYYIYARDIVNKIEFLGKNLNLWFNKDGRIKAGMAEPDGQEATFDELLFGIATHEIRHRVQRLPDFKKVDITNRKERESDARVVQYKAMKALHKGKSLDEIAKIIGKIE
jgi:hypothetical protein